MSLSTPDEKDRRSVVGQLLLLLVAPGYFELSPPDGGGQASFQAPRIYDAASIAVPKGYQVELIAQGLKFPTG
ncbi:MAG TPA: hypothetical protein VFQ34_03940 [Nitrospiraceae bacterium]|jgi:hypothetical protein|nr:hypothetical protein [Nitrospiraceae bacterium]